MAKQGQADRPTDIPTDRSMLTDRPTDRQANSEHSTTSAFDIIKRPAQIYKKNGFQIMTRSHKRGIKSLGPICATGKELSEGQ